MNSSGSVVGAHGGVHHFTIGQRKGLGISSAEPLYVIETDPATRRVVVGSRDELLRTSCSVASVNWVSIGAPSAPVRADVKIRNKHQAAPATLYPKGDRVHVVFDEGQRAVTPGQAAVFYEADLVLGGGWIE